LDFLGFKSFFFFVKKNKKKLLQPISTAALEQMQVMKCWSSCGEMNCWTMSLGMLGGYGLSL